MSGISFAATPAPATDTATPKAATSDKGKAFVSAMSDVAQKAAKPVAAKTQRSDLKDKDRKEDRDDSRDDKATASTAGPAAQPAATAANVRDGKASDGKKSDDKGTSPRTVAASTAKTVAQSDDTDPTAVDTRETPVDAAQLTPVMDALKQLASVSQQAATVESRPAPLPEAPIAQAEATAAGPLPATASLLAARVVPASAQQPEAKPAAPAKKSGKAEAAADKTAAVDSSTATTVTPAADHQRASAAPDPTAIAQPSAGQQLAAGGADRALDMAKQGAWLDGLSRDIAATGSPSSTLRFEAAPTHLGAVQVEIARSLEGAAVTLTASSEGARTALADAKPQLIAEARAQGIHIASAQVDVSTDSRQSNTGSQPDPRHDPRGQTSFSSQAGSEGSPNRQSQTRSQPFAINQSSESQPAASADTEEPASSSAPAGGMYA
ncbi:flagellar hook-length control protein FliK [Sphingomonas sp. CGMCC 1.13654]|uniref:Flagellar hook-length control protein FliK n=1 Tax=Sphingomonas chungangi TaxID=2683589 RepID=A0A838L352_9SPHN|nr:flagellar hook-length control protein FliK [Sphingomonas chungangi]MBA2932952.1 flagellar hook-length control protein FliK [Sphingomonas chungangi]MVW56572.1 hypothetical protein [Sphingomonas chungangi]